MYALCIPLSVFDKTNKTNDLHILTNIINLTNT